MRATENSIIHIELSEKAVIYIDRADRSMWMAEFSVTYVVLRHACLFFKLTDSEVDSNHTHRLQNCGFKWFQ
jgi:hypothetical protein